MTLALWVLIAFQIFMGALDTLYHHELTERLAWRQSQTGELKLHAARNLFYFFIFCGLALFQPNGIWAYTLIFALSIEFLITLRDFVEEDLTRKLPITERLLHTVITANYGAVLALLIPLLWQFGKNQTGLVQIWHGNWSLMLLTGAIGVLILGVRDFHAAYRLPRLERRDPKDLIESNTTPKTYLITGGTGFIGRRLIDVLQAGNNNIIVLTRNAVTARIPAPITLITSLTQIPDNAQIDVVINFAGEPLAKGLWTKDKQVEFIRSRIETTHAINALIQRLVVKPQTLINGSAIGAYGVNPEGHVDEFTPIENDNSFTQELCLKWEAATQAINNQGVRTVLLRIGMVLDREGGALEQLLVPTELGGGAFFGDGQIKMSWITRDDLIRMIIFAVTNNAIKGPLNGTAPNPVSNKVFTQTVAKALYRPTIMRLPKVAIKLMGGLGREILLADQDIRPTKALHNGFLFLDEAIEPAIAHLLKAHKK